MKLIQSIVIAAVFLFSGSPAFPQGAGSEWDILAGEAFSLYQNGKHDRAVVVAKRALEVAEKALGPDHPDVATSLNNLGLLYKTQGEYARAEPLYKRSLAILEKAFGPDRPGVATHPHVATILRNLAELYRETKREYEAGKLEKRAARRGLDPQILSFAESLVLQMPPKPQQELHLGDLDPKIASASFRENWGLILIFSAILTWGIGLAPPLLVRFAFVRKPMSEMGARVFVVAFFFVNVTMFIALGSESKTHSALFLVAIASYYVLRRGAKKGKVNDSPPPVAAEAEDAEELAEEAREAAELAAAATTLAAKRAETAAIRSECIDLVNSKRPKGDREFDAGSYALEMGKAYYVEEDYQEALPWLNLGILCGLSCADVYNLRGDCLLRCGRHDDAISDFNKAISLEPEDCNLYFQRANSKSEAGDFDGALQDLQEAIRLSEVDNELNRHYRASAQEMGHDSHTLLYALSIPMVQVEKRMAELLSTPSPSPPPS